MSLKRRFKPEEHITDLQSQSGVLETNKPGGVFGRKNDTAPDEDKAINSEVGAKFENAENKVSAVKNFLDMDFVKNYSVERVASRNQNDIKRDANKLNYYADVISGALEDSIVRGKLDDATVKEAEAKSMELRELAQGVEAVDMVNEINHHRDLYKIHKANIEKDGDPHAECSAFDEVLKMTEVYNKNLIKEITEVDSDGVAKYEVTGIKNPHFEDDYDKFAEAVARGKGQDEYMNKEELIKIISKENRQDLYQSAVADIIESGDIARAFTYRNEISHSQHFEDLPEEMKQGLQELSDKVMKKSVTSQEVPVAAQAA